MENEIMDKETPEAPAAKSASLSSDQQYHRGKILYDIGLIIFTLLMLGNSILFFLKTELLIGGRFSSDLLYFLYIPPCILMVIGLAKQKKAADRFQVKEKGTKPFLIIMSIVTALMFVLGTANLFHPSYHVYTYSEVKASDGRTFTVAKSERVGVLEQVHDKIPSYYDLDVYDVNGIFAKRLTSVYAHQGRYSIDYSPEKGYRLIITALGAEETYPFKA